MKNDQKPTPKVRFAWLISLAFWLVLFNAVVFYAAVALSPKFLTYLKQRKRWRTNQEKLVQLEKKVDYLKRVGDALENDPEFAAELARIELDASRPGDERIPVDRKLTLEAVDPVTRVKPQTKRMPWYTPAVVQCAENDALRRSMLIAAAGMLLFAFLYLHETQIGRLLRLFRTMRSTFLGARAGCRWMSKRYRRKPYDKGPWGVG